MLCGKCGKDNASVYVKQDINGKISEGYLCKKCAGEGLGSFEIDPSFITGNPLLNDLFHGPKAFSTERRCALCGCSFTDIREAGKVGCGECYSTFAGELAPSITRIHGGVRHTGGAPKNMSAQTEQRLRLEKLQLELKNSVAAEEYEKAARLRDEIRGITEGGAYNG